MVGKIYNNGNTYNIGNNYIGGGNHPIIWFKDIKDIYFYMDQGGLFTNLLGLTKGKLTIKYKQFSYSTTLTTLKIEVKYQEFSMVQRLIAEARKVISEEQQKNTAAVHRNWQESKKAIEYFNRVLSGIAPVTISLHYEKVLRNQENSTPYRGTATITNRTTPKKYKNFIAIDTETTGLKPVGNDIIEVTAIKFENCVPVSIFTTLLKPRKHIPAEATAINGITDAMVASAPTFSQIKSALQQYISDYPIVAHNASFDIKFLHVCGLEFVDRPTIYDTLSLSRKHIRNSYGNKLDNYKLATVCAACGIYFDGAHRSSADALAAGLLFVEIIKRIKESKSIEEIL